MGTPIDLLRIDVTCRHRGREGCCMYSTYVSYSRTFAQSNRETTVSFQDAYSNSKTVVGVVFHKFPADSGLRRVLVGKAYMCACMKQLVARAEAGPATRTVVA